MMNFHDLKIQVKMKIYFHANKCLDQEFRNLLALLSMFIQDLQNNLKLK